MPSHFDKRCSHYDLETGLLSFDDGQTVETEVVIGADGSFSAVRRAMLDQVQNFNYNQQFLEHGYKELSIPAAPDGGFAMGGNFDVIQPGGQAREVTTSTGRKAVVGPKANFGTLSSGGLY